MKKVLVDTSVWIEMLQGGQFPIADQLNSLLQEDRVVLCGAVEFELLGGARKQERSALETQLNELEYHEFERRDHRRASQIFKHMQSLGKTLKYADLMIAAFCMERGFLLLTLDSDFDGIPGLARLKPNRTQ